MILTSRYYISYVKSFTCRQIHVDRTATAWLIARFIDRDAEILFVALEEARASFLYDSLHAHLQPVSGSEAARAARKAP